MWRTKLRVSGKGGPANERYYSPQRGPAVASRDRIGLDELEIELPACLGTIQVQRVVSLNSNHMYVRMAPQIYNTRGLITEDYVGYLLGSKLGVMRPRRWATSPWNSCYLQSGVGDVTEWLTVINGELPYSARGVLDEIRRS